MVETSVRFCHIGMRECFAKGAYVQPLFGVTKGCIYATPFPHQVAQVSNGGFARNSSSPPSYAA